MKRKLPAFLCYAAPLPALLFWALSPVSTTAQTLQVFLPDYSTCEGEAITLTPQVTGGVPPYTFAWSPAGGLSCTDCSSPVATTAETTTYSLTVTDADHAEAVAATIVQVFPTDTTIINGLMCEGEGYELDGQYLVVAGIYQVTFPTEQGCDSIVILYLSIWPPLIAPSKVTTACIGADVTLSIMHTANFPGNCSSQWYRSPNIDGPWTLIAGATQSTYEVPTDEASTWFYRATYSCEEAPCDADTLYPARVTIMDVVASPVITLTPVHPLCPGGRGNITASVSQSGQSYPYRISWSDGTTTFHTAGSAQYTRQNLLPGSYCVTITNGTGCPSATACTTVESPPPIAIEADVIPNACASSSNGSISTDVSGGAPPYNYTWSTGGNTASISGLGPGNYRLTVTDANNCVTTQLFSLGTALVPDAGPGMTIDCIHSSVELSGSASLSGPDIGYAWYGPNGAIIGDQASVTVAEGGVYRFRVIDNSSSSSCYSEDSVRVVDLRQILTHHISATLTACNTYLLRAFIPNGYTGPIDLEWTRPDGSMSSGPQIIADETGVYQLRAAVPGSGCEAYLSRFVYAEGDVCSILNGRVVLDEDANCIAAASEAGLGGWIIRAKSNTHTFHAVTAPDGSYHFSLPWGIYTVSAIPPSSLWLRCVNTYIFSPVSINEPFSLNIPVRRVLPCPELSVQLSSSFLRRCFSSRYHIKVCNTGTVPVDTPEVTLVLDAFLEFQSAEFSPDAIQGQTLRWRLPLLDPGECRQFWVDVLVSCSAQLGQAHCSRVMAIPDRLCRPTSPEWSGASLELASECTGAEVIFRLRNAGTGDLSAPVAYTAVRDEAIISPAESSVASLASGEERIFTYPANGSTYFFYVEQAPHHPFGGIVSAVVEGCGTDDVGAFSTGYVNQLPGYHSTPATFTLCRPNVGAYDPNDKQAIPVGYGPEYFIRAGDPLQYQIRFQNTGTDTAFTVIILDTLSPWLDITTLRAGPSSHNYRLDIAGERTLVFTFDNILLPDSTTNLEASQGFVDFFIRTLDSIPIDTRIENSAAIYFDFNEPIITNTVFHTIGRDFMRSATAVFQPHPAYSWRLFPNPATDEAWLIGDQILPGKKTIWIYDALGRLQRQIPFEGDRCLLRFQGLMPGWYALQVRDAAGLSMGGARVLLR